MEDETGILIHFQVIHTSSILTRARSLAESITWIAPLYFLPFTSSTSTLPEREDCTTCAFVTISPSCDMINPDPAPFLNRELVTETNLEKQILMHCQI